VVADKVEGDAMKNDDDALCNGNRLRQQYVEPESPKCERGLDTVPVDRSALIRDKSMTDEEHESRRRIIQEARAIAASERHPISPQERLEMQQRTAERERSVELGRVEYKTIENATTVDTGRDWEAYIEGRINERLAQERERSVELLSQVIGESWRRQRRENKRELADELRTLRIEVANFSAELSELRAIMAAERGGKVLALPASAHH
jgi:hypothetical protein